MISDNLRAVKDRIAAACESVGRNPKEVTLIAVSKTKSIEEILEAYNAGQRDFGESRYQEALPKIEALPDDIAWHFIGSLQSNKARNVATCFPFVHTLCSESQIREIDKAGGVVQGFLEINIAREPQKSGLMPENVEHFHQKVLQSKHIHFLGPMTIGPVVQNAELIRPYFKEIRALAQRTGSKAISMGMSGDYEVAIQEGSTHVRVGSAIFGSRTV